MTHVANPPALSADPASREVMQWVREHWIMMAALALIAAELWLKGAVLAHSYFRQDDFAFFDRALDSRLNWSFLMRVYNGHMMPGSMAFVWVLARADLYDWSLTSAVTLGVLALSSLALFRVLRTMLGSRPAVLVPLTVYLFTPILLPGLSFWSTTFQWVPTQLVIAMALNAHVTYVKTGRFWHAIVAAAWILAGLLFDDVAVLLPVLFFALTSAFFVPGRWAPAVLGAVRRYWRAWTMYGLLCVGYAALFFAQLQSSGQEFVKPGPFTNVLSFASTLARVSLIPGALGGPWHWLSIGNLAFAVEFPVLTPIAWAVAAIVVLVSVWFRRRAFRAWIILAAWVVLSTVVPLIAGRVGVGEPQIVGADLHYLADTAPVLAICIGLAFWPAAGEEDVYRGRPHPLVRSAAAVALMSVFLAGSLWSTFTYLADTTGAVVRSYMATAAAAVAAAPAGSVIADTTTPPNVETATYFGRYGYTSQLIGPLVKTPPGQPARHLTWMKAPSGVIKNLLMFDPSGRLAHTAIEGRAASPPPGARGCWNAGFLARSIPIPGTTPMYYWPWTLALDYHGPAVTLAVTFGQHTHDVQLPAGQHRVYIPALGSGSSFRVQVVAGGPAVCITHFDLGNLVVSYELFPIPADPVSG
jgi:hypothetical protein